MLKHGDAVFITLLLNNGESNAGHHGDNEHSTNITFIVMQK